MPLHSITKLNRTFPSSSSLRSLLHPTFTQLPYHSFPSPTPPQDTHPKSQQTLYPSSTPRALPTHQSPSSYYASLLRSCIARKAINPGKQLHAHLFHVGLGFDLFIATKLVNLIVFVTL
ncbi:hypothetical protein SLA2020_280250 [Shorea laevis]